MEDLTSAAGAAGRGEITHAVLPGFVAHGRLDVFDVIGPAFELAGDTRVGWLDVVASSAASDRIAYSRPPGWLSST
ncbi:MAG: hypothetical protein ACYCXY_04315 [Acidimicrobiales bacterium]